MGAATNLESRVKDSFNVNNFICWFQHLLYIRIDFMIDISPWVN